MLHWLGVLNSVMDDADIFADELIDSFKDELLTTIEELEYAMSQADGVDRNNDDSGTSSEQPLLNA